MDVLELARQLSAKSDDRAVDRWAERLQEVVAKQTIYLVSMLDRIPESLKEEYFKTLQEALRGMPEHTRIEVSRDLIEAAQGLPVGNVKKMLEERLRST